MCDKQRSTCSCPAPKIITPLVISCKVEFDNNRMEIQSHSLSKIFSMHLSINNTKDMVMSGTGLVAMRICINRIVQYVNSNGGWNLMGWTKTGEIVDAVDGEDTLASEDVNPHLIKMTYKNVNLNMDTLEKLKFDARIQYTDNDITRLKDAFTHQKNTGQIQDIDCGNGDEDDGNSNGDEDDDNNN